MDISLSGPPDGNEYFSLYMSHSLYSDENKTILIKPEKGENPKLEILRMSMSRTFSLNLSGDKLSNDDSKNKTSAWESALGFTLRADYNLEDDWVFRKFLKSASKEVARRLIVLTPSGATKNKSLCLPVDL